jgi:hypothetical protein
MPPRHGIAIRQHQTHEVESPRREAPPSSSFQSLLTFPERSQSGVARHGIAIRQHQTHEVESPRREAPPSSSFQSLLTFPERSQSGVVNPNRSAGKSSDKAHRRKNITPSSKPSTKNNRCLPKSLCKPQRNRSNDVAPSKPTRSQSPSKDSKSHTRNRSNDVVSSKPKSHGHSTTSVESKPTKSLYEQNRERRQLRFDDYDEIREIASVKDFSDEQKRRLWFTEDEITSIREDCLAVVNLVNEGHPLVDVDELGGIYGLEKSTKALEMQMLEVTHRCINTVIGIQRAKRKSEKKDFAAKMYFLQSAKATLDAHVYAIELANEVKNY